MRISDWSSDVCSSDLNDRRIADLGRALHPVARPPQGPAWNLAHLDDLIKPGTTPPPAAVLVPLVERGGSVQVVLTRRTDALRHHGGKASFPRDRKSVVSGTIVSGRVDFGARRL